MKVYVILDVHDMDETMVLGVLTSKEKAEELTQDPDTDFEEFELDEIEIPEPMKFKVPEPLEDLYLPPPMPLLSQITFSKV